MLLLLQLYLKHNICGVIFDTLNTLEITLLTLDYEPSLNRLKKRGKYCMRGRIHLNFQLFSVDPLPMRHTVVFYVQVVCMYRSSNRGDHGMESTKVSTNGTFNAILFFEKYYSGIYYIFF